MRQLAQKTERSAHHRYWGGVVVAELAGRIERELAWIARLTEDVG
jgi:hypothetical protein